MDFETPDMEFGSQVAKVGEVDFEVQGRQVQVRCVHHATDPTEPEDALSSAKSSKGPMLDFALESRGRVGYRLPPFSRQGRVSGSAAACF